MLLDALLHAPETSNAEPPWLVPVDGRSLLEDTVWNLARYSIRRVFIAMGTHGKELSSRLASRFPDMDFHDLETAELPEALTHMRNNAGETFVLLDGRVLFDCNYFGLEQLRRTQEAHVAVALTPGVQTHPVLLDNGGIPSILGEGGRGPTSLDSGVAVLHRSALAKDLPATVVELLGRVNTEERLVGMLHAGFHLDMRLYGTLEEARQRLPKWRRKPAVFLDRDGVLNEDRGYVHTPEQFAWTQNAPEAVKRLNDSGALVIVLTNQSGIARGFYSEDAFRDFTRWIGQQLAEHGGHLDATYHCPHHPEHGDPPYRCVCDCRKPAAGLIDMALADWSIDLENSVLVGDSDRDLEAAAARGITTLHFQGGDLLAFLHKHSIV